MKALIFLKNLFYIQFVVILYIGLKCNYWSQPLPMEIGFFLIEAFESA